MDLCGLRTFRNFLMLEMDVVLCLRLPSLCDWMFILKGRLSYAWNRACGMELKSVTRFVT
jgi:hypothetical protein